MNINQLTAAKLKSLRGEARTKPKKVHDGGGLYVRLAPHDGVGEGSGNFYYRVFVDGKPTYPGGGSLDNTTLAAARAKRDLYREQARQGISPVAEKAAAKAHRQAEANKPKPMTFEQAALACHAARQSTWKNKDHADQWISSMRRYVFAEFGGVLVAEFDTPHIVAALQPIWTTKVDLGERVRARIQAVLNWAESAGVRSPGMPNPARLKDHLDRLLGDPKETAKRVRVATGRNKNYAALPYEQVPAFMTALRQRAGQAELALEFAIRASARTEEILGLLWSEVDLKRRLVSISAERMKADDGHVISLGAREVEILRAMAADRKSDYVFPGIKPGRPMSGMVLLKVIERMGFKGSVTTHGFRSSFVDWAAEMTTFPTEAVELALAHAVGGPVRQAYRRGNGLTIRRQLAQAWGDFIDGRTYATAPVLDGKPALVALQGGRSGM